MKVAMIALIAASVLSGTCAFAQTPHHHKLPVASNHIHQTAEPTVVLHPNNGNPNGNPDGPTTLSGTGDSAFGGSSPGDSGHN